MFGHDNNQPQDSNGTTGVQPHVQHDDNIYNAPLTDAPHEDVTAPVVAVPTASPAAAQATDDLLDIKHQALQALTPLVDQLEQTPEEQFRTTMMMIQASDDHGLIKVAYEAAQKIANEKERAQALLDIVNEINYFTQQA